MDSFVECGEEFKNLFIIHNDWLYPDSALERVVDKLKALRTTTNQSINR